MCTCSWVFDGLGGYDLYFNRDEQWSRKPALPPSVHTGPDARYLAPIDADAGGTWLGVNEFGVTIGLLNRYQDMTQSPHPGRAGVSWISRGLLVRELLRARSAAAASTQVSHIDTARYQPFTLVALDPTGDARLMSWNGAQLALTDAAPEMPLCSSSWNPSAASAYRRALLGTMAEAAGGLTPAVLEAFHQTREADRAAWGPCMRRDDAHTVSLSHVCVRPGQITLRYAPGEPCEGARVWVAAQL
jgi:Transport and Golgi organisation 2